MIITFLVSLLFSVLSTAIMSYIALATATGPWIEPTLVLLGIFIFRFMCAPFYSYNVNQAIGFSTIAGGIGGIIAIACSWTIPTLFFLDPSLFKSWLHNPLYFATVMSMINLGAGGLGFIIAHVLEDHLLHELQIPFPIGELVHKMIYAQDQIKKTIELLAGATITIVITIANKCSTFIGDKINLIPALSFGLIKIPAICLRFDLFPLFLSIGFVTGHVIAIPLLFGLISKLFLIEPLQRYFFASASPENFLNTFVSGIVIQGACFGLLELPHLFANTSKQFKKNRWNQTAYLFSFFKNTYAVIFSIGGIALLISLLLFFKFSLLSQLYLLLFTVICTYQVLLIAGKTGLAPFPRFATFVLVPGMILFGFNATQIMVVSAFVEICCGVAVDVLFGRKMAQLSHMNRNKTTLFQLLGLIASSVAIGFIFYFLIHHFGLGSPELFAQRAKARALLVKTEHFNYIIALIGALFGFTLRFIKMNYLLVIGSLLMQPELSFSLILGGLLTYIVKDKEEWYPFWSGVFAASSLFMLMHAIFK